MEKTKGKNQKCTQTNHLHLPSVKFRCKKHNRPNIIPVSNKYDFRAAKWSTKKEKNKAIIKNNPKKPENHKYEKKIKPNQTKTKKKKKNT